MASIMIVDDEEDIRFIFTKVLSSRGHSVESAESGSEAIEKFGSFVPDLIIMDSKLPDMNGIEITKSILKENSNVKILGATGYSNLEQDFLDAGAVRVLAKPFSLDELVETVNEILME